MILSTTLLKKRPYYVTFASFNFKINYNNQWLKKFVIMMFMNLKNFHREFLCTNHLLVITALTELDMKNIITTMSLLLDAVILI